MSMITCCPACETLFKVVPDQLRISEGWVRCGQCDETFDAAAHWVTQALPMSPPAQDSVPAASASATATPLDPVSSPSIATVLDASPVITSQFQDLDLDFSDIEKNNAQNPDRLPFHLDFGDASVADEAHAARESESGALGPPSGDFKLNSEVLHEPEVGTTAGISFLNPKSASSRWRRPLVRTGLSALALGLVLTLAGQFLVHERNRLAAHEPRLTPWLTAICRSLACSLAPVQQIEAVVIESSSFARVKGDTYLLSFTLKNTANIPLAMPAIELTLTDALDQPLLRGVVLPSQLAALPKLLEPGIAKPAAATFLVKLEAASQPMAGYRLLAFYP